MGGRGSQIGAIPISAELNVGVIGESPLTELMRTDMNHIEAMARQRFGNLMGAISENFGRLRHVQFDDESVLGTYNRASGTIDISSRLTRGNELGGVLVGGNDMNSVMAHELGHALTTKIPSGYRSAEGAFDRAYSEYRRSNRSATQMDFATSISAYAGTAKREAFAEAFSDVLIHGNRANQASQLIMNNWRV